MSRALCFMLNRRTPEKTKIIAQQLLYYAHPFDKKMGLSSNCLSHNRCCVRCYVGRVLANPENRADARDFRSADLINVQM